MWTARSTTDLLARCDNQRHSTFRFQSDTDAFVYRHANRVDIKTEVAQQVHQNCFVFVNGKFLSYNDSTVISEIPELTEYIMKIKPMQLRGPALNGTNAKG